MLSYYYDHIHLISPDPVKTAEFYEKMFNAKRVSLRELGPGRVSIALDLNGTRILLMSRSTESETTPGFPETDYGLGHFGIMTDDLEAAVVDLKAKGVQFKEEIREIGSGIKISYLWGPENVLIELLERNG